MKRTSTVVVVAACLCALLGWASGDDAFDGPIVGKEAPDFEVEAVVDGEISNVKLSSLRGSYVILFFYPLDFTFVCPTEILAFSDRHDEFSTKNTKVIGMSTDSVYSHLAWTQKDRREGGLGMLKYPLASDLDHSISKAYRVYSRGKAMRGLFLIDPQGIIQHMTVNNDAFGRSVDETLRTLQALQYVQQHPDHVCPAGWKPGDDAMKPDPQGAMEYFGSH